jgi:CBS-domain-containing membrane protein
MNPRSIADRIAREVPLLRTDQKLGDAVRQVAAARVPALPVVDRTERFQGILGEREFIAAIFPGYVGQLRYAGFIPDTIEEQLERRSECRSDPVSRYMNTEHIDVGRDASDFQLAETFMHHRVLIIPIVENGRVLGVVTRWDFFIALVERFV